VAAAAAVALAGLVGAASVLAAWGGAAGASSAVTVDRALVVRPGTTQPLPSGGSATPYGVVLPAGAACPGDTAHAQYRVYSYLVPSGVSLTSVSDKGALPARYYGFIAQGGYYFGAVNTAEGTGQIVAVPPAFSFSRLTSADLFGGGGGSSSSSSTWNGGIACVNTHGVVTSAWNTQFRFVRDPADPGGFRWTVTHGTVPVGPTSGGGPWIEVGIVLVAVSVVTALLLLFLTRSRHRNEAGRAADGPGRVHGAGAGDPDGGASPRPADDTTGAEDRREPVTSTGRGR
jgi:hypothetical protein